MGAMTAATTPKGERRRSRLIAAAGELLLEGGFDAVRHRAVADRAQLPLASTTYYFGSLDELLVAVYRESAQRLEEAAASRDNDGGADPAMQAADDIGLVQLFARGEAEVGGNGNDDVAGAAALTRRFADRGKSCRAATVGVFEQVGFSQGHQCRPHRLASASLMR